MVKSNFHTHTVFCDGKNTPEEMVLSAKNKGFTALGFSGHGPLFNAEKWSMPKEKQLNYRKAVLEVKQKYQDKLQVFCGIEQDLFSDPLSYPFDYIIGSVHRLKNKDLWLDVDLSAESVKGYINEVFNGNFNAYAKVYYEHVVRLLDIPFDVVGHVDLVTKFNEVLGITLNDEYFEYAEKAIKQLSKAGKPFEINTGAMARGYRTSPYPDLTILKMIKDSGCQIMINSDCHVKEFLDCGFDKAQNLALQAGFTERVEIGEKGLITLPLTKN